jgi:hypothetical protein
MGKTKTDWEKKPSGGVSSWEDTRVDLFVLLFRGIQDGSVFLSLVLFHVESG